MYSYLKQNLQISGATKFLRILPLGTNCPTEKLSPGLDKLPTKVWTIPCKGFGRKRTIAARSLNSFLEKNPVKDAV